MVQTVLTRVDVSILSAADDPPLLSRNFTADSEHTAYYEPHSVFAYRQARLAKLKERKPDRQRDRVD